MAEPYSKHPESRPVILAVDDDAGSSERITDELQRRYGRDYRILSVRSIDTARSYLAGMRESGDRVAVVLVAPMSDLNGIALLEEANELHPHAKRAVLIEWGDWSRDFISRPLRAAIAAGHADYYVLKPWKFADELFHRTISEFLHEWVSKDPTAPREIVVVAEVRSSRGAELRNLLDRNSIPFVFQASDSPEGRETLRSTDRLGATAPIVKLVDGRVLDDPTNAELAVGYGAYTSLHGSRSFDVAVIGAGPAGLAAAVYASSEGLSTLVVERYSIGGQAGSSSRIRNYLGFARGISGAQLATRAHQQAWVFGATFLVMCEATGLRRNPEGAGYLLATSNCAEVPVRSLVLATGVNYRRLNVPALEGLENKGVFYGASRSEAPQFAGADVYVVGGGNSAGQAAVHLCTYASRVTIVVRGTLTKGMSRYLIDEIESKPNIDVRLGAQVVDGTGIDRLESLTLQDAKGLETVPADALFVLIGAQPFTGWLPTEIVRDEHGFVATGPDVAVTEALGRPPFMFEASMPGVFAVGDARSGSVKRVASAVGEGSVVIHEVHRFLEGVEHQRIGAS
ncbi:MAG: FAD-dependent oxidoreductase [Actinomycetota bacterium]